MPRTKLSEQFAAKEKPRLTLEEIPSLPTTLTIEEAAAVAGVGYQGIRLLIENEATAQRLGVIKTGAKRVIPTWTFLVEMKIFPEYMLEKIYMQRMEWEHQAQKVG